MIKRYRPFSNGSQFVDWQNENCCRCKKYQQDFSKSSYGCEIADVLDLAMFTDGTVSEEIAQRMGLLGHELYYTWDCPEREEEE